MNIVVTLLLRELKLAEHQLASLDGPLAVVARRHVYEARMNVETIERLLAKEAE